MDSLELPDLMIPVSLSNLADFRFLTFRMTVTTAPWLENFRELEMKFRKIYWKRNLSP